MSVKIRKYTFATVSLFSMNNTECPTIDTFEWIMDSFGLSLQPRAVPTVDALRE